MRECEHSKLNMMCHTKAVAKLVRQACGHAQMTARIASAARLRGGRGCEIWGAIFWWVYSRRACIRLRNDPVTE